MDLYILRKAPRAKMVKGFLAKNGKTVRAMMNYAQRYNYEGYTDQGNCQKKCYVCNSDGCDHMIHNKPSHMFKYTDNSHFHMKDVRKCDCCPTHVCENTIPIRGRSLRIHDFMTETY